MPIQRIHVENFKSFSGLDVDLSQLNVVIGSNAAGKSNFIAVFRFLRDIATVGIVGFFESQITTRSRPSTSIAGRPLILVLKLNVQVLAHTRIRRSPARDV